MKVLFSIKPEFVEQIFSGKKKFEFRRLIFKNEQIKTVVVYASSPVQKVIGEFDIEAILSSDPKTLWKYTKEHSGISEDYFFEYFGARETGFAIMIKEARRYRKQLCLREDYDLLPPQSFLYLT